MSDLNSECSNNWETEQHYFGNQPRSWEMNIIPVGGMCRKVHKYVQILLIPILP